MYFGARLARLRRVAGHTQVELARAIGASQSTISQLEAGTRKPSFDMLHDLSAALGVPVSSLVRDRDERLSPDEEAHFLEYRSLADEDRQELRRYAAYLRQRSKNP